MQIFDLLPEDDLFNVAGLNSHFRDLILQHYLNRKYDINWAEENIRLRIEQYSVSLDTENGTNIAFGAKQTLQRLSTFGHFFRRMNIEYDTRANIKHDVQQIASYMHRYCRQAKQQATVRYYTDRRLNANNHPSIVFEDIEHIRLVPSDSPVSIRLNETFPRMQHFHLVYTNEELPFIGQYHPHLTSFRMEKHFVGDPDLFDFIRLNPQIRHFEGRTFQNHSYFRQMSETFTDLETLIILNDWMCECANPLNETIQFESVKHFELFLSAEKLEYSNLREKIPALQFGHLETFKLAALTPEDSSDELIDVMCELIAQNHMLHSVELVTPEWSFEQMQRLFQSAAPASLKTVTFKWYPRKTIDDFRRFLEENRDIERISVELFDRPVYNDSDESDDDDVSTASQWRVEDVEENLPAQWTLEEIVNERFTKSFVLTRRSN